jgi:hypothetical protein
MRPLRAVVLAALVIGCSNNRSDETPAAKPEGAVAIILQSVGDLPKLEMRVAFAKGIDPGPHIEPLAGAIVEARKTCFAKPTPAAYVAALHVEIKGGMLSATAKNEQGKCVATALDKQPVKDAIDASVEMQLSVATK